MKLAFRSLHLKIAFSIVTLAFCLVGSTYALPRDSRVLSPGPVRPSGLDYRNEVPQGYLEVYSATDEFDDGGVSYHAHSSYSIYTMEGKIFKNVENHISRSDELPEVVTLPVGSYVIEARSERDGYVRVRLVIKAGRQTILDLESRGKKSPSEIARN